MAKNIYVGVSGVARSIKDWWVGVDSAGYRLLFNVPIGSTINIGGNKFTIINHGYNRYGFSGTGTILWGETPVGQGIWKDIMTWRSATSNNTATGVDTAYNTTITNMAFSNHYSGGSSPDVSTTHKFRIIPEIEILSESSAIRRDNNGNAVPHWLEEASYTSGASAETNWEYYYGPWWFYYVDSSGTRESIRTGSSMESSSSTPSEYPGRTHNYYYYYACEVDGNTKVTYNSTSGIWELYE